MSRKSITKKKLSTADRHRVNILRPVAPEAAGTSLPDFFNAAHEAGKHTFTVDPDYRWFGMLLRKT
jgi:hypothetical protein